MLGILILISFPPFLLSIAPLLTQVLLSKRWVNRVHPWVNAFPDQHGRFIPADYHLSLSSPANLLFTSPAQGC